MRNPNKRLDGLEALLDLGNDRRAANDRRGNQRSVPRSYCERKGPPRRQALGDHMDRGLIVTPRVITIFITATIPST